MEINDDLKKVLNKISFVERYKMLSKAHNHSDFFENYDNDKVISIIKEHGYDDCKYHKRENFFAIEDYKKNQLSTNIFIGLHVSLEYGRVDFILNALLKNVGDGGPFSFICKLLGENDKILDPRFSNHMEMQQILIDGFKIYEDIKTELRA